MFQRSFWRKVTAAVGVRLERRWRIRYRYNKKHLVMDALIALSVLFLVGLNIFWLIGGWRYFSEKVFLAVELPRPLTIGEETEIRLDYRNDHEFELDGAVLSWRLPDNFELLAWPDKADASLNSLHLGRLAPQSNGTVILRGRFWGEINREQAVFANLSYYKTDKRGGRLWGQFNYGQSAVAEATASVISLRLAAPEKVLRGQKFTWAVEVENTGELSLSELTLMPASVSGLVCDYGDSALMTSLSQREKASWNFVCSWIEAEAETEAVELTAVVEVVERSRRYVLASVSRPMTAVNSGLKMTLSAETNFARPGQAQVLNLSWKNEGREFYRDARIVLKLRGDYWADGGDLAGAEKSGETFIWSEKNEPDLILIEPGDSGEYRLVLPLKEVAVGSRDLDLGAVMTMSFSFGEQSVELIGPKKSWPLQSNLSAALAADYYFRGEQLGRGPWPPRAGEETKVWVFARLVNDIGEAEKVSLTAGLPVNVEWTGKSSVPFGEPLTYGADGRLLWRAERLPAGISGLGFAFEVSFLPTEKEIHKIKLLENISLTGRDAKTGDTIEKNLGDLFIEK